MSAIDDFIAYHTDSCIYVVGPSAIDVGRDVRCNCGRDKAAAALAQMREALDVSEQAIDRLLLWPTLHGQQHPEWNGNRFDDQQLGKKALAAIEKVLKSHPRFDPIEKT